DQPTRAAEGPPAGGREPEILAPPPAGLEQLVDQHAAWRDDPRYAGARGSARGRVHRPEKKTVEMDEIEVGDARRERRGQGGGPREAARPGRPEVRDRDAVEVGGASERNVEPAVGVEVGRE